MNKIDLSHDHASNGRRLEIRKSSDRTPKGKIVQDISEKEKQHLTMGDLLQFFEEVVD